jgi:lysophospholipase L1-like esterase
MCFLCSFVFIIVQKNILRIIFCVWQRKWSRKHTERKKTDGKGKQSCRIIGQLIHRKEKAGLKTILFQGDSITDAGRSTEDDLNMGYGYPTLVSSELGLEYANQYRMLNRGVSGDRIIDLYARIKADIINLKPDIMSILIGVNDIGREIYEHNGTDADKSSRIYSMLIEELKEALPDVKIMILEPFILKGAATEMCWEEFQSGVSERAKIATETARKYGLPFISLQNKFDEAAELASNDYWLRDGIHPTAAGHEIIKREWIKAFKEL